MSALLTGFCPNCGNKLRYEEGTKAAIVCNACDSSLRIEDMETKNKSSKLESTAIPSFAGFDNPESGVVFLENFFDTYDWESYQQSPEIAVEEIAEVIGNNKVKNGAVPETWYLDFMGLYVPVTKKFEGLAGLEKTIVDKFDAVDPSEILSAFDTYRVIGRALLNEREAIEKTLGAAIKYAERFSLKEERLAEMKAGIKTVKDKYATLATKTVTSQGKSKVAIIDKIEDLPAYETAKNRYASKSAAEFSARGIDAKDVYSKALAAFKSNQINQALSLFESIRSYSDSERYINKINQYFDFWGEVYRINGKHFVYKTEAYKESILPETLDLKGCAPLRKRRQAKAEADAKAATDALPSVNALSLYEVVEGELSKEPVIKGIEKVVASYGTKLFFIKVKKGIAYYDLSTGVETIVDTNRSLYCTNDKGNIIMGVAKHAPVIYIKKMHKPAEDELVPSGCLKKNKAPQTEESPLNPYNIVLINMVNNNVHTVVSDLVDIKMRKDDKIFYTFAYIPTNAAKEAKGCMGFIDKLMKKPEEGPKPKFKLMVCDIEKGVTAQVLDDDCDIQEVDGDNIIYTHWKPNDLNMDLHVYNMSNGQDTVIEENVYDFFSVIDGKIYYTIGNEEFRPLVRANFDGSDREQVMRNIKSIELVRGGWFYVTKGTGYNSLLVKIKIDGSQQCILCRGINSINRFEGNLIYYSDVFGNLRSVRIDGKEDRLVAEQVKKVFPAEDGLYYCRDERVGAREVALSLYHMDKDGKNIKKVIFNVDRVQDDDISNTLYYSKQEKACYRCYEYGKESEAELRYFNITKYYYIKKSEAGLPAENPVHYLTIGAPKSDEVPTEPKGCIAKLKKEKQVAMIYEEVPIVHSYKNRGLTDAEIAAEQDAENDNAFLNSLPKWMPDSTKRALLEKYKKTKQTQQSSTANNGCSGCSPM